MFVLRERLKPARELKSVSYSPLCRCRYFIFIWRHFTMCLPKNNWTTL